jgi:hypothetical protein
MPSGPGRWGKANFALTAFCELHLGGVLEDSSFRKVKQGAKV